MITHFVSDKKQDHELKLIETQGQTGRCSGIDEDFNMLLSRKSRFSRESKINKNRVKLNKHQQWVYWPLQTTEPSCSRVDILLDL